MADDCGRPLYSHKIGMPADYAWTSLKAKCGAELAVRYVLTLRELDIKSGRLGRVFTKARNKIQAPTKLSPRS